VKKLRFILYVLGIVVAVHIASVIGFSRSVEYKAQDTLFRLRGSKPISNDIVIIAIDDNTFQALNITWPFPRELHAKLIENLNRAGVKQIVFDIEFIDNSNPHADSLLAATAAKYNNVIFAGKVLRNPDNPDHIQVLTPINQIMRRGINWGIVNTSVDADGFIRNYKCFDSVSNTPYYSIGLASVANSRVPQTDWQSVINSSQDHISLLNRRIPLSGKQKTLINYYGPGGTFTHLSFASVIDDESIPMPGYQGHELDEFYDLIDSGILKNKTVLIGATIDELHDQFHTPFSSSFTAGVEIHANFIEMVHAGDFLKRVSSLFVILLEFVLLTCLWLVFKAIKPQLSLVLVFVLAALYYYFAYYLFSQQNLLIPIVQTVLSFFVLYLLSVVSHYLATQKEKKFIRSAFQQYLAPELVSKLLSNPHSLTYGGSLQEISVLFSDIRSFTTYSENHEPEETVQILKEYLTAMVNVIITNGGILDKFVGDEIMALYGTPVPLPNHALAACKTALMMREKLTELQERWRTEGREPFEIGIGINTGLAVVGNLGSEQIFDYTAIGDTINLGARLESINKEYDTQNKIIISEFTLEKVSDFVIVNYLDEVKVKGKNQAVKIYELLGVK